MLGVTLVGAVQAVRGVIWFALAAAAILPIALDGLFTRADVAAPRVNRTISRRRAGRPRGRARRHARATVVVVRLRVARAPGRRRARGDTRSGDPALGDRRHGRLAALADPGPPRPDRVRRPLRALRRGRSTDRRATARVARATGKPNSTSIALWWSRARAPAIGRRPCWGSPAHRSSSPTPASHSSFDVDSLMRG